MLQTVCTDTLRRLRKSFAKPRDARQGEAQKIFQLTEDVQRALFKFESTSNHALMRVYRRSNLLASESFTSAAESMALMNGRRGENGDCEHSEDNELLMRSGVDETVFLVYL